MTSPKSMSKAKPIQVNALTVKSNNGLLSQIITQVRISIAFDPMITAPDSVPHFDARALWDTGATKSMIAKGTAEKIGLIPVGTININHAGGSSQTNTYAVNFLLPNRVGIVGVLVSEGPDTFGNFEAIIGMDIMCRGDFSITNVEGKTVMSFRVPSIKVVDYVVEIGRQIYAGIKPYAPCPCGKVDENGKRLKFKDCHKKELA